jgi:hypothetical protein
MSGELAERLLALAAVALVAALAGLALGSDGTSGRETGRAPAVGVDWEEAIVGTFGPGLFGHPTTCGQTLRRGTLGIAHPVLPCGARLVVAHDGREADARVIDQGSYGRGQEFALTRALADTLGVEGRATVRWRFFRVGLE